MYSIYDFGDFDSTGQMGDPYMQLLSIIEPDEASVDFHNLRGGTPKTNITYVGLNGPLIQAASGLGDTAAQTLDTLAKFMPAILGIVALNALVLIVLCIAGVVYLCRRRTKRRAVPGRTPRGRLSPMPMNPRNSYIAGASSPAQTHTYQPILSMAMTEDLNLQAPMLPGERARLVSMAMSEDSSFQPPSPGFRNFDGSGSPADRHKLVSMAMSEDVPFQPPNPAFLRSGGGGMSAGDRPRSVA